jgi:hypothetical protein
MVIPTGAQRISSLVLGALLLAGTARAQEAAIAGVVKDPSGAVMPGVTVTAASSVLIEQQRVAITDGEGRYIITQLRPGTYSITFNLLGFAPIVREGVGLTAGFTANVDVQLRVGSLSETITVTGASPVVDVVNVRKQTVVSKDQLEALPTSTKSVGTLATITTGLTGLGDVGGSYQVEPGQDVVSGGGRFHGKSGTKVSYDGMGMENSSGNSSYQLNSASVEELVMSTSGISADTNADGLVVNVIPKEGSNTFRVELSGLFANHSLESSNLDDNLRTRGLTSGNRTIKLFDESASVGGPITRDKLWFFVAPRSWGLARGQAGVYWNQTQNVFLTPPSTTERKVVVWTPWVDRPIDRRSGRLEWYQSILSRVTWQASTRNKFNLTYDEQRGCNCGSVSAANSQENYGSQYIFEPNRLVQVAWTSPVTSKLLLEAGAAATISQWNVPYPPGVTNDVTAVTDTGLGISYGSPGTFSGHPNGRDRYTQRASLSYVTGSHNFKTGFQTEELNTNVYQRVNGDATYTFRNGTPISITQRATPYLLLARAKADLGAYAQDQWKVSNKLTLNVGIRWDYFNGYVPAQRAGFGEDTDGYYAGASTVNPWLGQRTFDPVNGVPVWKDWDPRLGIAYDLFGNGRTAFKVSLGRYVAKLGTEIPETANPISTSVTSVTRGWTDNGNFVPDCNLGDFAANGECGAISNQNFGKNNPLATRYDPAVLNGYGKRDFNWDFTAEVQHELSQGVAVSGGYYRNTGGYFRYNFGSPFSSKQRVTDNLLVAPADYDTYCVTAPRNPKLPGGGGYQVCGLADIKPSKFGQVQNLVSLVSNYGTFASDNNFFNVSLDARLARGIRLGGGVDTGRSVVDRCFVVDSPQELLNCRVVTPFTAQTQFKLHGIFPLPGDVVASFLFQNLAGPSYDANYSATNADIAPSLGRNLAGGVQAVTIPLVPPQTLFEDRVSRLDLRLSKVFSMGRLRVRANVDAYNVLNANSVRSVLSTYGARWRTPTQILDPRLVEVGGTISF